jgi:hypothetical protein
MKSQFARVQGFSAVEPHWNKLLRPDILTFSTSAIEQEMKRSLQDRKHHHQGQKFEGLYVVVSTIPEVNPAQAMTYFAGGYTAFVDSLLNEPGFDPVNYNLAHWVCCYDGRQTGVHLTFLPAEKVENSIIVVAQDLMTVIEKSKMGIA